MKKIVGILLSATVFASCGKTIDYAQPDYSAAAFINASPSGPIFNVLVDGVSQTSTSLIYRSNTAYLNLTPGARSIALRSNNPALPVDYVALGSETFESNKAATFIAYDTLQTPTSKLKVVRLSDDLTTIVDGVLKVRFVNVAVNSVPMDVTLLRTTVTPNDSVTITNQAYIGSTPAAAAVATVSQFRQIPGGNYTIKLKATGTQTVLTSATIATTVGGIYKGNFTLYATGTAQGQPLAIGTLRQLP
jgi:hypothetical protein